MPLYRYICEKCKTETKKLVPAKDRVSEFPCPQCGSPAKLTLGIPSSQGLETTDEYRDVKQSQDLHKHSLERSREHFRKVELPRMIEKHGKAYAIEHGFIDIDGNPKN